MVIEALDENLIAQIRSSSSVDSVTQCVTELVLNSLDAKSTSIAVRVNLATFRIQVVDDGRGISGSNLDSVGVRYMTNKCHSLEDLKKHVKYYGFKGEALASISQISQRLTITSKERNCEETYEKIIEKDEHKVEVTKSRASCGTTVTVEGFLHSLPVRRQCVKNNELDNIKRSIESLIIIHPRVSFTLRNDLGAKLLLSSVKCADIASSFKTIHPNIDENDFALLKVTKHKIHVEGLIHNELHENKRLQYIYVNKRPILCDKVQNLMNSLFKKSSKIYHKKKHPVFVVHIKCPHSHVDVNLEPTKTVVFFKKFDVVKRCIEKMINAYLGENVQSVVEIKRRKVASEFGISQIDGVVKGVGTKRKTEDLEEVVSNKSEKITVDPTPVFDEPKLPPPKQAKLALPIEIKKNEKREKCEERNLADSTLFTNFPENEERGKNVIMDMFILSLKAFPPENTGNEEDENASPPQTDFREGPNDTNNIIPLDIQPTLNEVVPTKKMVSVGVQTNPHDPEPVAVSDFSFFPRKSLQRFVSDYNFDFSRIDALAVPNLIRPRREDEFPFFHHFDETRKLFDFRNNRENLNCFANLAQPPMYLPQTFVPDLTMGAHIFDSTVGEYLPEKKALLPKSVQESPYFAKKVPRRVFKQNQRKHDVNEAMCRCHNVAEGNLVGYKRENQCTDHWETSIREKNVNEVEMTFVGKDAAKRGLNESSVSKYFTPKKVKNCKRMLTPYVKPKIATSFDESKDLFHFTQSQDNLVETIDKDNDNFIKDKFSEEIIGPTLTQTQPKWSPGVDFESIDDHCKKLTVLKNPKKDHSFGMAARFEFVPKGLSPILKDYGQVDDMSPEGKERLQNAIIQSYEDELMLIKWQNCMENKDPRKFFEEIYLEKSKLIEGSIPNIHKSGHAKHGLKGFENMGFTRNLFKSLKIIGQVDRKFIAAVDTAKNLLLLFDQHAVHERVRLEELSESYKTMSIKLDQNITIFMPQGDLNQLKHQRVNLETLGLVLNFFTNGIAVLEVPLCVYNKSKKGVDIVTLTGALIKDIVETLNTNNGILVSTPKVIQNIVNSEACRGAIKFGDLLSRNECIMHLKKLADCDLPFQCAHGRPTLTPLMYLSKNDTFTSKPNLSNLKR